jgi:hypothetical protein
MNTLTKGQDMDNRISLAGFPNETGCYVDDTLGIYTAQRICSFAIGMGWAGLVPTDEDCQEDMEYSLSLADEAIDFLNMNNANEGFSFGWHDGGLYYWSDAEWQDA